MKRVRIIGKGHASCFESLLKEWYDEGKFVDVFLTSKNFHDRDGDICPTIPANKR